MNSKNASNSEVYQRLLWLQSSIPAAPDERRLMEMLVHGLEDFPGMNSAVACLDGRLFASNSTAKDPCAGWNPQAGSCDHRCPLFQNERLQYAVLATAKQHLGPLFFLWEETPPAPISDLFANLANLVALRIEHDRIEHSLAC